MAKYAYFKENDGGYYDIVVYNLTNRKYMWLTSDYPGFVIDGKWEDSGVGGSTSPEEIDKLYGIAEKGGMFLGSFNTRKNPVEVLYG